ncbi:hypothetical protein CSKR_109623 [Clonorchis sinensis]|uniref:Nuclear receptor domain-containing protein n=1 Tax=Clonorchis sinensis TaxID=79923 RepID=A0A8T1MYL5_CLOSI|nr:hypothetical protein CSKR_109623 [Clonorchis sinensis]
MLSGPTYSTDFLTNRIMGVEPPSKKRRWDDSDHYLDKETHIDFQGNSIGRFFDSPQMKSTSSGFVNDLVEPQNFLGSSQTSEALLSSNYARGMNPLIGSTFGFSVPDTDKFPIGNREELTTPNGLTGYDSSILLENSYLYVDAGATNVMDAEQQQMLLHSRDPYPFGLATTPPLPTAVSQMTTNRPDLDATTLLLADQCFLQHRPNNATPRLTGSCGSGSESSTATTFDLVPQSSFATEIGNGGQHPYLLPSHLSDPPLDHVGSQLTHEHDNTRVTRLGSPLNCPQPLLCFDGSEILQQHSNTNKTETDYVSANGESTESAFVFRCSGNETRKDGTNSLSASEHDVRDASLDELYSGCMEFVRPANEGHVFEELQSNPLDTLHPFDTPSDSVDIRRDKVSGKFKHTTHHNTELSGANSEKRCKVCGDRAVNHNFGQLTCESCKAFFRRNAHKVR